MREKADRRIKVQQEAQWAEVFKNQYIVSGANDNRSVEMDKRKTIVGI